MESQVLLLLLTLLTGGGAVDVEPQRAKASVLAYSANVKSFEHYSCRWRYTKAKAESVNQALQGKFLNAISYEMRLLVDGERELKEDLAEPRPIPLAKGTPIPGKKGLFATPKLVSSDRHLSDGKRQLAYIPQMTAANIALKDKHVFPLRGTPLGMGFIAHRGGAGSPEERLARPELYELCKAVSEEIDGRPVITLAFLEKQYATTVRYSLDMNRGYLPVRICLTDREKKRIEVFVTEMKECTGQRWFPMRTVVVRYPDQGTLCAVTEIRVLELDVDRRPAESEFAVDIPAGTLVFDPTGMDPTKWFKLRQGERIALEDLPKLFDMLERSKSTQMMDTKVSRRGLSPWSYCPVVCVLGAGFMCVFKRWQRRRHLQP